MKISVTTNSPWAEHELSPIRDKVYSYLKDAILRGEFKAGERLVERNLAEKLNLSRTPIREALFRLESEQFVSTVPRKGVVVNKISQNEIIEVFMILSSLEPLAVRLATQKIDSETVIEFDREIEIIKNIFEERAEKETDEIYLEANLKYNDLIGKASKSIRLHEMLTKLKDYIRAFSNLSNQTPGRSMEALEEHLNILIAIRNGQADLAEKYTLLHIEKAKLAYINSSMVDHSLE